MKENKAKRIRILLGLIVVVSLLHYGTPWYKIFSQELFIRFYYLPIFLGGLWFGFRGGLIVSLSVTLVYIPYIGLTWGQNPAFLGDVILEVVLFNLIGPFIGFLVDKERQQRALNQDLQTLATLGEAAASMAHEMKNVVIPIHGFLRRVRETCSLEDKAATYLDIARQEAARLEEMTTEMLAYSRRAPLKFAEVEIGSLLQDVSQCLHQEFQEKGIQLVYHNSEDKIKVLVDGEGIRRVIINLLRNSLDASPAGAQVQLRAQQNQNSAIIVVEDQGEGIHPADLHRIFHPFYTTKPKGTGLGLAITRRIVTEHGGEIRVESTLGQGTTISLELPLAAQPTGA